MYVKDFPTTPVTWTPGKVTKVTGPLSYHVEVIDGREVRRHVDAVRTRDVLYPKPTAPMEDDHDDDFFLPDLPPPVPLPPRPPPDPVHRSTRHRPPPDRL